MSVFTPVEIARIRGVLADKRLARFDVSVWCAGVAVSEGDKFSLAEIADCNRSTPDRVARALERLVTTGHLDAWVAESIVSGHAAKRHAVPPDVRNDIYERDGHSCVYCGSPNSLTVDHSTPVSRGGLGTMANLVTACLHCNIAKGNQTRAEYEASK